MSENRQDWEISSQASKGLEEGSTSNANGLEQAMRRHERGAMRSCSKCGQQKEPEGFHRSGKHPWCRACVSEYDKAIYQRKRALILEQKAAYRAANKEKRAVANRLWHERNPGYAKEYQRKYRKQNKERIKAYLKSISHIVAYRSNLRRARLMQATPSWANLADIVGFYEKAKRLTSETGIPHEVDHIVPLANRIVCGLHVPANLRVITRHENATKKNKLIDDVL
jgi:hypothetical protein